MSVSAKERLNKIVRDIEIIIEEKICYNFIDSDDWVAECKNEGIKISRECINNLDNNELAFVVCHEYAHDKMGHQDKVNNLIDKCSVKIAGSIDDIWDSGSSFLKKFFATIAVGILGSTDANIQIKSLSRDNEYVADKIAIEIMKKAGYNTNGAHSFLQKYGNVDEGFIKELFSAHPSVSYRLGNIS